MSKVDVKMKSKRHDHKKSHATNSSRNRKQIRKNKRSFGYDEQDQSFNSSY
ncbi:hypothetical protein VPHD529_0019 [Vibrio phage D529]